VWHCGASFLHLRTKEEAIWAREAWGTFCVLVAYTDPQKVSGASKEPMAMRFAVQANG
jgi:hypothetical protein